MESYPIVSIEDVIEERNRLLAEVNSLTLDLTSSTLDLVQCRINTVLVRHALNRSMATLLGITRWLDAKDKPESASFLRSRITEILGELEEREEEVQGKEGRRHQGEPTHREETSP